MQSRANLLCCQDRSWIAVSELDTGRLAVRPGGLTPRAIYPVGSQHPWQKTGTGTFSPPTSGQPRGERGGGQLASGLAPPLRDERGRKGEAWSEGCVELSPRRGELHRETYVPGLSTRVNSKTQKTRSSSGLPVYERLPHHTHTQLGLALSALELLITAREVRDLWPLRRVASCVGR